jgi:hypothetical protein
VAVAHTVDVGKVDGDGHPVGVTTGDSDGQYEYRRKAML